MVLCFRLISTIIYNDVLQVGQLFFVPNLMEKHVVKSVVHHLLHLLWIEACKGGEERLVAEKRLHIRDEAECPSGKQAYVGNEFGVLGVDGLCHTPKEFVDF